MFGSENDENKVRNISTIESGFAEPNLTYKYYISPSKAEPDLDCLCIASTTELWCCT